MLICFVGISIACLIGCSFASKFLLRSEIKKGKEISGFIASNFLQIEKEMEKRLQNGLLLFEKYLEKNPKAIREELIEFAKGINVDSASVYNIKGEMLMTASDGLINPDKKDFHKKYNALHNIDNQEDFLSKEHNIVFRVCKMCTTNNAKNCYWRKR